MRDEDARLRIFAFASILICGLVACAAVLSGGPRMPWWESDSGGIVTNPADHDNSNRSQYGTNKVVITLNISIVASRPSCLCIGVAEDMVQYTLIVTEISGVERMSPRFVHLSISDQNSTRGFHNLSLEGLNIDDNVDLKVRFGDLDKDGFLSVGDKIIVDEKIYQGLTFILHGENSSSVWWDNYCMYYLYDWEG